MPKDSVRRKSGVTAGATKKRTAHPQPVNRRTQTTKVRVHKTGVQLPNEEFTKVALNSKIGQALDNINDPYCIKPGSAKRTARTMKRLREVLKEEWNLNRYDAARAVYALAVETMVRSYKTLCSPATTRWE